LRGEDEEIGVKKRRRGRKKMVQRGQMEKAKGITR
jgi:hypothetical protein